MKFQPEELPAWLATETPEPQWLIEGFLPSEGLVCLSGPRKKAGKTWLGMVISAVGSLNHPIQALKPQRQFSTLFIEEEGTTVSNKKRWKMLCKGASIDPKGLGQIHWAFRPRLKLDQPGNVPRICAYVKKHKIDLVVLDAVTYMHTGDENSKRDMQAVISSLMTIRAAGCTVLWISHTGKGSQRAEEDIDLAVRGSSVMMDVYDSHLALRRSKVGDRLGLTCRHRDAEETYWEVGWQISDQDLIAIPSITTSDPDAEYMDYLKKLASAGWTPGDIQPFKEFATIVGLPFNAAADLRNEMIEKGYLERGEGGKGVGIKG